MLLNCCNFVEVLYNVFVATWWHGNETMNKTNETMEYNVGDLVMVTKDIQFKINGDICHVLQGSTGTVTEVGNVPMLYGGTHPMVVVNIDGVKYNLLASDICYKI